MLKHRGVFKEYDDFFSWQDALMYAVTKDKSIVATSNFDDAWKYLKTTLSDREAEVLELRYEESMRLKEIADTFNISKERVRQIEDRALRKLRHPKRARILLYGSEYIDALEEFKRATDEVRYKKFNSVFEDLNNKFNSVASELLELEDDSVRKMIIQESLKKEVFLNFTLDDLDISVRTYNSLKRAGIKDIKGILEYSDKNGLSMIRNFGISCFEELKKELHAFGCCKELVFKKE